MRGVLEHVHRRAIVPTIQTKEAVGRAEIEFVGDGIFCGRPGCFVGVLLLRDAQRFSDAFGDRILQMKQVGGIAVMLGREKH